MTNRGPDQNDHEWIQDYCDRVLVVFDGVPPVRSRRTWNGSDDRVTAIDDACFDEFLANYGCEVRITVYPFDRVDSNHVQEHYSTIRESAATDD